MADVTGRNHTIEQWRHQEGNVKSEHRTLLLTCDLEGIKMRLVIQRDLQLWPDFRARERIASGVYMIRDDCI